MVFDKADGKERGKMHSINGYIFGNLRGLVMKNGERVRWHVLGLGNEIDVHTAHWHGKTVTEGAGFAARRTDVLELLPGTMITADMLADNPGEWLFHCHVADHIDAKLWQNSSRSRRKSLPICSSRMEYMSSNWYPHRSNCYPC